MLMIFAGGSGWIDLGFVITKSYGRIDWEIDRLIEGQYDLQVTPQTEQAQVKRTDICLIAMLGLRIKMDCSIPINSIPRCSAITEVGQLEEEQKETKDQIKRVAPSHIQWSKQKIGITATDTTNTCQ